MAALIALLVALFALGIWIGLTYNRLVAMRLACENSWAQVDVALKLRHDLIPVLAESVAGYAGHEQRALTEVAERRAQAMAGSEPSPGAGPGPGQRGPLEGLLGGSLGRLMILAEDYPDLRATENFSALQRDLAQVEEKISITRRVYNDVVERYNTAIAVFPPMLVARALRFERREFFEAGAGAEIAPEIDLGGATS